MGRILTKFRYLLDNRNHESKRKALLRKGAKIGNNFYCITKTSGFGTEPWLIQIGNDACISCEVLFITHDGSSHVINVLKNLKPRNDRLGHINIGNNCFIGCKSIILQNVTIGDNVIIGAGSVVTHDCESGFVYAGVPAKKICSIDAFYEKHKTEFIPTAEMNQEEKKYYYLNFIAKNNEI